MPSKIRIFGIICYIALFIVIASTLYVGLFYIIGIVSLIGMFPSSWMDWFETKLYKDNTKVELTKSENVTPSLFYKSSLVIKNYFIAAVILFCLMMNLGSVREFPYALDATVVEYGKVLRLEQNWGMFSPYILKDDGWFVYSGFNEKHQYIDIKHNKDIVSFDKPMPVVCEFESDRWRKFQENYTFNNNNYMRPYYCKYLINKWNKEHPDNRISDLTIFFMKETSLPDYETKPTEKIAVCNCQDK